tara:strand:- start:4009 stop:5076 length:1068 start_codon:yes stop_codon:yes gene_type:complete
MAINVNDVYKTVLSILNKEQRGYLTPYEYNNLAVQAQKELLDKLFYDYNKFLNLDNFNRINEGYADIPRKIQEQIDEFYTYTDITLSSAGIGALPLDLHQIIDLSVSNATVSAMSHNTKIEKVNKNRLPYLKSSPLTEPTTMFPIYYQRETDFVVEPAATDGSWALGAVRMQYIQVPEDPRWGYRTESNYGINIYDSNPFVAGGVLLGNRTSGIVSTNDTVGLTDGTYPITLSTPGVSTSGSGTGIALTITVSGSTVSNVEVTSVGTGFAINDTITISAFDNYWLGANDVILTLRVEDLYSSTTYGSTDFRLHISQEPELIITILGYAGLVIKDPTMLQQAVQLNQAGTMSKSQQ